MPIDELEWRLGTETRAVDPETFEEPDHDHRVFHDVDIKGMEMSPDGGVQTIIQVNVVEYRLDGETVDVVRVDWDDASEQTLSEYTG